VDERLPAPVRDERARRQRDAQRRRVIRLEQERSGSSPGAIASPTGTTKLARPPRSSSASGPRRANAQRPRRLQRDLAVRTEAGAYRTRDHEDDDAGQHRQPHPLGHRRF
jgi:hypothetical protein